MHVHADVHRKKLQHLPILAQELRRVVLKVRLVTARLFAPGAPLLGKRALLDARLHKLMRAAAAHEVRGQGMYLRPIPWLK